MFSPFRPYCPPATTPILDDHLFQPFPVAKHRLARRPHQWEACFGFLKMDVGIGLMADVDEAIIAPPGMSVELKATAGTQLPVEAAR